MWSRATKPALPAVERMKCNARSIGRLRVQLFVLEFFSSTVSLKNFLYEAKNYPRKGEVNAQTVPLSPTMLSSERDHYPHRVVI